MKNKILILGANGFIGHHLIKSLKNFNYEIFCMDINKDKIIDFIDTKKINFFEGDISINTEWIEYHIQKCDIIVPLVAIANPLSYVKKPLEVFKLDFEANLPIIKHCVKYRKKLIFPSTSEVYGKSKEKIFDPYESDLVLGPINKQRWIYSCIKQLLDRYIFAHGVHSDLSYTIFRPFNWFGTGLDDVDTPKEGGSRVITQFLGNIKRKENLVLVDGGSQKRSFTHINDGIGALTKIINDKKNITNKKIYNIGNPQSDYSIKQLADKMLELAIKYKKIKQGEIKILTQSNKDFYGEGYQDVQNRVPSIKNTQTDLNWEPKIDLGEGLEKLVQDL